MKHIIILGDGMADHAIERLGGKTLLQHAHTPYMNMLAREGRCGRLVTIPDGFLPGSEIACLLVSPLGDPRAYWICDTLIALRGRDARHIELDEFLEKGGSAP